MIDLLIGLTHLYVGSKDYSGHAQHVSHPPDVSWKLHQQRDVEPGIFLEYLPYMDSAENFLECAVVHLTVDSDAISSSLFKREEEKNLQNLLLQRHYSLKQAFESTLDRICVTHYVLSLCLSPMSYQQVGFL